jgi:hypothetical protein
MLRRNLISILLLVQVSLIGLAQTVTTPKEEFGFNLGDDFQLANYQQLTGYWRRLAAESDRMVVREIGLTAEGRTMLMAIITSPENHEQLGKYQQISRHLALAKDLNDEQANSLSEEGKAVVWIDGGLHATEVLGAQQLMETVFRLASSEDSETLRILRDVILLAVCVNPDGLDLVGDWYMRKEEPAKRSYRDIPRLYQKYVGHDNNRDFYLVSQPESEAISKILYREWFPQIAYNHHQTGPAGTVLFAPPFRDPFNYNLDPLVPLGIELVGAAMHNRFVSEGKPGATMRSGARYSTWWNGGLRTTQYFHNIIGLLTETVGSPNPMEIPLILRRQLPHNDLPYPISPQTWHFRQSIEYSVTANMAVLDVASRYREHFLYNIYRMGKNSIERGSRDHWTITPNSLEAVGAALEQEGEDTSNLANRRLDSKFLKVLQDPDKRDARGYVIPSDQPDFLTAVKFVNTLIKNGVIVHQATSDFSVNNLPYPARSFVVKTDQAFRPHILDMFEPQNHPDDFVYVGGPPTPPYDSAGWTLAFQMGIEFDRVLEGFEGPFVPLSDLATPPPGSLVSTNPTVGYLLDQRVNDATIAVNRLLKNNLQVYWVTEPVRTQLSRYPAGVIFIPKTDGVEELLNGLTTELGLRFEGTDRTPAGGMIQLRPVRIALWDRYGGSMPSGWIRWILERFEFPHELVFPARLDAGNLRSEFDVIIFSGNSMPAAQQASTDRYRRRSQPDPETIPEEYWDRLGRVTSDKTVPQLRDFLEEGGTILALGRAANLGYLLELPIMNPLQDMNTDGNAKPFGREKYYVPGSVLSCVADSQHPLAFGIKEEFDIYFNNSPVFGLQPEAERHGIRAVAWFDNASPLRSGWAWGQHHLKDTTAVLSAKVGKGTLFLFGPEITFRAQPHGTFKFLFNGIYLGTAEKKP